MKFLIQVFGAARIMGGLVKIRIRTVDGETFVEPFSEKTFQKNVKQQMQLHHHLAQAMTLKNPGYFFHDNETLAAKTSIACVVVGIHFVGHAIFFNW